RRLAGLPPGGRCATVTTTLPQRATVPPAEPPARPTASPSSATPARLPATSSETALLLVHVSVVLGFSRLYEDGSFLGPLLGFVVGSHVMAVACRRRRVPAPAVALLAVGGAALTAAWVVFPGSTRFGLPTTATWDLAREALRMSRVEFQEVTAPAPVLPGFQLTAGLALWGSVWFADWTAFRLRATVEAVAPAAVLFVFCAMLGSGDHRIWSTMAFTGAVLGFVASHRALRAQLGQAWLATSATTGPRAVLRAGVALAVVGMVGGAAIGPVLPGSDADAVIHWRATAERNGDRTTVSPIVDLRKRLVNQEQTELFMVTAEHRAYWRLTALDRFDGQLWTSSSTYSAAGDDLTGTSSDVVGSRSNEQHIRIQNLSAIWAPAAYQARSLEKATEGLSWDPRSGTLIVDAPEASGDNVTSDGLDYVVVSEAPVLEGDDLRAADGPDPEGIAREYLELPEDFPDLAIDEARGATAHAEGRYDQAIALQNFFRTTFEYSLDVPAGHGDSAIVDFLESRTGYCEQFAGTYAAMARSLGMPARVAVGFTPGDLVEDRPDTYQVRGRHAHAWPEVYFTGIGWVPFEPTPGRGMPGAQAYTGLSEQQEAPDIVIATSTTTSLAGGPTTTTASSGPATRQDTVPRRTVVTAEPDGPADPEGGNAAWAAVALAGLGVTWAVVLLLAPGYRRRRRPGDGRSAAAVLHAWERGLAPVRWLTGLSPRAVETHDEFARRAAPSLGEPAGSLRELADLATGAAWSPTGATAASAERAATLADDLLTSARNRQSTVTRIRRRLSWREAFGRPRLA
ncbi:MAG: hypothetical protein JWM47_1063, partial [Acidimicrobiales bacterium]|nr:hypothetical protein [Acidimicrobiales bacterium]